MTWIRIIGLADADPGADVNLSGWKQLLNPPQPFSPPASAPSCAATNRTPPAATGGRIETNGIVLDPGTREVTAGGKRVELTTFEFDILEMLMRSAGRVHTARCPDGEFFIIAESHSVRPLHRQLHIVRHLRKKLLNGDDLIKTIRGVGYQFCRTPEDAAAE